jgi:hypothetical protein
LGDLTKTLKNRIKEYEGRSGKMQWADKKWFFGDSTPVHGEENARGEPSSSTPLRIS